MSATLRLRLYTGTAGLYLTAHGTLDADTATHLARAVGLALDRYEPARITIDLAGVDAADTAGIAMLVRLRAEARLRHVLLSATNPQPHVHQAIRAAHVEHVLPDDAPSAGRPRSEDQPATRRTAAAHAGCLHGRRRPRRPRRSRTVPHAVGRREPRPPGSGAGFW